jgi:hypothetical protein
MKSLILVIIFSLFSFSANADVFRYQLYEDSLGEFTPFVLSIEMDGKFDPSSKVKKIGLSMIRPNTKLIPLFQWNKNLNDVFKFKWVGKKLSIKINRADALFKAVVSDEISNPWGDTSINPDDQYAFGTKELILDENGSLGDEYFYIENMTSEESCLWGILKRVNDL